LLTKVKEKEEGKEMTTTITPQEQCQNLKQFTWWVLSYEHRSLDQQMKIRYELNKLAKDIDEWMTSIIIENKNKNDKEKAR
jgi:hypothetical protein